MWQICQKRQFIPLLIEEGDFLPQDVKKLAKQRIFVLAVNRFAFFFCHIQLSSFVVIPPRLCPADHTAGGLISAML